MEEASGNNHPDLTLLPPSDLLRGFPLAATNWKPKAMTAQDVVHAGQAPRMKQGGEGRRANLEGTSSTGYGCKESTAKRIRNIGEQSIVATSLVLPRPWGLTIGL